MRLLVSLFVLLLLASPVQATQPSFFVILDGEPDAGYFAGLEQTLPGSARHPQLHNLLVDALYAVSEVTWVELQYGFEVPHNIEYPMWVLNAPIWPESEAPQGWGSVVYSRSMLLDAEGSIATPTYERALLPYLAMWPHARLHLETATAESAPLAYQQIANATELLCGWWIGQQADATLADCDAIAGWRSEFSGEEWNPGPMLRVGYTLRDYDYEEVINLVLPPQARWLDLEPQLVPDSESKQ